jgi:hypothetical protein
MKSIILVFLVFHSNLLCGQLYISDTIYKDINKLRTTKTDTVIRLSLPSFHGMLADTLLGIGKVIIYDIEYLIVKQNNTLYSKKYVCHCTEDCIGIVTSISEPLKIRADSLLYILGNSIESFRTEEIYPYIYQIKDNNNLHYNIVTTSHPSNYFLGIYTLNEDIGKSIGTDFNDKQYSNFPENLNYKANVSTKLYTFFKTLSNYIQDIDKLYKFKAR